MVKLVSPVLYRKRQQEAALASYVERLSAKILAEQPAVSIKEQKPKSTKSSSKSAKR